MALTTSDFAPSLEALLLDDRELEVVRTALTIVATLDQNRPGIKPVFDKALWVLSSWMDGKSVLRRG